MLNKFIHFEKHAVCEIMCSNTVEPDRPQITIWRMRYACWISMATNTHSEYVQRIAPQRYVTRALPVLLTL